MKALAAVVAMGLLAAGCAPTYPVVAQDAPAAAPLAAPPPPLAQTPPRIESPPPRSAIPQPTAQRRDACGAAELQSLVGRPRTEIPVPVDPTRQRVACTSCPVADDVDPGRLNFLFDAQTGRIRQIRCG